jgi:hypothetical protein
MQAREDRSNVMTYALQARKSSKRLARWGEAGILHTRIMTNRQHPVQAHHHQVDKDKGFV